MIKRGLLITLCCGLAITQANAQLSIDKVKNMFGSKKEPSKIFAHVQFLSAPDVANRTAGSSAEQKVANYIGLQFGASMYKPYLGKFIHPFNIDKKNNLSEDSYIEIYNKKLELGVEVVIPPFSGIGKFKAQALPSMPEPDNLWFIKFTDVGVELNNKYGNGLEKMYKKAKESIEQGATAVMFINNEGESSDFANSFSEMKTILSKPVFILNHAAYLKYIVHESRGKEWVNVNYDFSKTRRTTEGQNIIGYRQNQTEQTIVIAARYDKLPGKNANASGVAALIEVAERINFDRLKNYNYIVIALSGTADDRKGAEAAIKLLGLKSDKVSCMINIDDVGALNNTNELFISGLGTSPDWEMVLGSFIRNFSLNKISSGEIGSENHRSFYNKEIPALNIFTKRTTDQNSINIEGVERIATSIGDLLLELDKLPKLKFVKTKQLPNLKKLNFKVSIGITPDYAYNGNGVLVGNIIPRSPAEYSNIQEGDIILRMDEYDIRDLDDYVIELAKYNVGDRIMIKVMRAGVDKQMQVTFR